MQGENNRFTAPDYDTLVDCPIVAGSPTVNGFVFDGVRHLLVSVGANELWDGPKAIEDVQRIVSQHHDMWGSIPYSSYVFLNLLTGGGGGLEHRNSVVMMADRFAMRTRSSYVAWLDLVSHEFFHVWNVKRLRPIELGPFDYENEVYTHNLWIAEGFTEYYGLLALRRSGLMTEEEFLGTDAPLKPGQASSLSAFVERLQTTPGRLQQSVSLASFDAWIKLYRPDENSVNCSISYYTKGAVIAWLLDARIRVASSGVQTLDHVMRLAFSRHSAKLGFSSDDFINILQELTGRDVTEWLKRIVTSTDELDYGDALAWFGLRFKASQSGSKGWCGFTTKSIEGRLMVTQVPHGTPASDAGISPDDEILGIDNYRVRPEQWDQRMEQYGPGRQLSLLLSRRDRLINVTIVLGGEPGQMWRIEVDPAADTAQKQNYANW
jgi:predicted metalloprotease with PDZ domain